MKEYVGRFAPSPTGPLHFGSLFTAVASYLDAMRHGGKWLVRIEDVDMARCSEVHVKPIFQVLRSHGMRWRDEDVLVQSLESDRYALALADLAGKNLVFECPYSRREVERMMSDGALGVKAQGGAEGFLSPARNVGAPPELSGVDAAEEKNRLRANKGVSSSIWDYLRSIRNKKSLRFRAQPGEISFCDRVRGEIFGDVERETGDFVLLRKDGMFAYQLAVVVDDGFQGVTHVVRGGDLLDNTVRQMALQKALGHSTPVYAHLPLIVNSQGQKWSKQTMAPDVGSSMAMRHLWTVFTLLGILDGPYDPRRFGSCEYMLEWGAKRFEIERVSPTDIVMDLQK